MSTVETAVAIASALGQLVLALDTLARRGRSVLALPITLLCVSILGWTTASVVRAETGDVEWRLLDRAISPWSTPLALHVVLAFVGRLRLDRRWLAAVYAYFGGLGVLTAAALVIEPLRALGATAAWSIAYAAGLVPAVLLGVLRLRAYLAGSLAEEERTRARWISAGFVLGLSLAATELAAGAGVPVPTLGPLAALVGTVLLALGALHPAVLGQRLGSLGPLAAGLLAAAIALTLAVAAVVAAFPDRIGLVVLATFLGGLVLVALARRAGAVDREERERRERWLQLGRVAEQLAHDLRNPLAAALGAVQFLAEEARRGRGVETQGEMLALLEGELRRLSRLADSYHRLGRVEPRRARVDLGAVARGAIELRRRGSAAEVAWESREDGEVVADADADLLAIALDSAIENALDACAGRPEPRIELATVRAGDRVRISVGDNGCGMDARTAERALDDLFTTKPGGTGLGLAFVRRVVQAHGGRVEIQSTEGVGTRVVLELPAAEEVASG